MASRSAAATRDLTRAPRSEAWLWLGTLLAFSPALDELISHWLAETWALPSVLASWFLLRVGRDLPADPRRVALGLSLLGAGLALEGAAFAAGPAQLARVGLACGLVGMALYLGRPPLRYAPLYAALVPVPFAIQRALDPLLRPLLELPAAAIASLVAAPTQAVADGLVQGERALRIYATDLGLANAAVLAAAAWAACAKRGASVAPALVASAGAASVGLALQLASLVAAAAVLAGAGEVPARRFLHVAPPALAAAVAVIGLELALRAGRRSA